MTYLFAQDFDDTALRLNPVVECNYQCSYCAVGLDIPRIKRCSLDEWKLGFDRIPKGTFDVVSISGGEPLLLKHLPELCNAATRHHLPVRVYTNLSRHPADILGRLTVPITWRATVHPETRLLDFGERVRFLLLNHCDVTVVAVRGQGMEDRVRQLSEAYALQVVWDDDLWGRNEKTQGLRPGLHHCTNHIWLFGPDGKRYPCVRHLMTPQHGGTPFWEVDWTTAKKAVITHCDRFGDCLSCDGLIRSEVHGVHVHG